MDAPKLSSAQPHGVAFADTSGAPAQQTIIVDNSKMMWVGALAGLAAALSIFTLWQCWITERDERALFIAVQDQNALMLREGIKLPTDEVYGPANNLEYGMRGDGHGRNRMPDTAKRYPSVQRNPK